MRRSAAEAVDYVQAPDLTDEDAAGILSMSRIALA
jgi:hypothetical protein